MTLPPGITSTMLLILLLLLIHSFLLPYPKKPISLSFDQYNNTLKTPMPLDDDIPKQPLFLHPHATQHKTLTK
jgi:hypothetical protein